MIKIPNINIKEGSKFKFMMASTFICCYFSNFFVLKFFVQQILNLDLTIALKICYNLSIFLITFLFFWGFFFLFYFNAYILKFISILSLGISGIFNCLFFKDLIKINDNFFEYITNFDNLMSFFDSRLTYLMLIFVVLPCKLIIGFKIDVERSFGFDFMEKLSIFCKYLGCFFVLGFLSYIFCPKVFLTLKPTILDLYQPFSFIQDCYNFVY